MFIDDADIDAAFEVTQGTQNPAERMIREAKERFENTPQRDVMRPHKQGATRFTTQYAIDWAKARGWRLLDRERYDVRTKRHHDLLLGADALFEGPDGMIAIQGAGRYERSEHWERFTRLGGADKARKLHIVFYYLEFERASKEPVVTEEWA